MSVINEKEMTKPEIENILKALNTVKLPEVLAEIIEIPGKADVGIKIAEDILNYRDRNGFFTNLMQIKEIQNIGPKRFSHILNSLKDYSLPYEVPVVSTKSGTSIPLLRYDVPSPSSYEGKNYIELKDFKIEGKSLPFNNKARESPTLKDLLELNRDNIYEYLMNASKLDLERDLLLVFDLDEIKAEELVVQYPGTYSFADGTLEGWDLAVNQGSIAQVMEKKGNHTKVVLLQAIPYGAISNTFEEKTSGAIEFWIMFTNVNATNWWNQVQFQYQNANIGSFYVVGGNLKWYTKTSANANITHLVEPNIENKWIHLRVIWDGNNVFIFVDGTQKLTTRWFPGKNKIDKVWFGSWTNQEVWIDGVGYSWDPDYNIGDNLIEQEIVVSRQDVKNDIVNTIKEIDPIILSILDTIEGKEEGEKEESSFRAKYQLFNYFMRIAIDVYKRMPVFDRKMGGNLRLRWKRYPTIEPRLILSETYKLTNFPGDYGAGTTIKTFSLLPLEETNISVKTWKKSVKTMKEASSILDSYTEEKADEFEQNIQQEFTDSSKVEESTSHSFNISGGVSWGAASISAGYGMENSSSSARETFARNATNATSKHAQKASSKREVTVETSFESTEDTGEEITIVRKIENLNASRTLNFTFRQMNQQFHSLLHLTDVRIAFFNGFPGSIKEYTLYELHKLVEDFLTPDVVLLDPDSLDSTNDDPLTESIESPLPPEEVEEKLRSFIASEYENVFGYEGNTHKFVEKLTRKDSNGDEIEYLRVIPPSKKDGVHKYVMREDPLDVRYIDGIITGRKVLTMRTDGVIVEALLGQSNALDQYSIDSRKQNLRTQSLLNDKLDVENKKIEHGLELLKSLTEQGQLELASAIYKDIFGVHEGLNLLKEILGIKKDLYKITER